MRFALGMYTEMSPSTPVPAFKRALSLIYRPVLSYLYNNPGRKMSLYQSAAMIKHIDSSSSPEVNMLIASLSKRGDLDLITGSYSQAILSLNPTKDRSLQIEKMTTLIRRTYGVKAVSCFFYGQIWSPTYIHTLKSLGLSSVVISAYKATARETIERESFIMNELGKRVRINVPSDEASSLVSRFAQGLIGFDELSTGLHSILDEGEDCFLFLNIDQLLEGAARDGSDERLAALFIDLMEARPDSSVPMYALPAKRPGYLDSGWYGRDAWARGLMSFNDLFVRNENYRYLLNRYLSVSEVLAGYKKDKTIKREAEAELFHISMGPLFIYDAECTPLRYQERKLFWKAMIEAERKLYEADPTALPREYDFEEAGTPSQIARNKTYSAVLSPKGGALSELCYMPLALNIMDTRTPFDKTFPCVPLAKSFSDIISFGGMSYDLSSSQFDLDVISKTGCEYQFMRNEDGVFSIIKHFRLRSQTLVFETLITAECEIDGTYSVPVYLSSPELSLSSLDQRQALLLGSLDDVKTVRYTDQLSGLQLSFSSTEGFSLREERARQSQNTSLGVETFELYTRLLITFPLTLEKGETKIIRVVSRVSDNRKDKE